MEVVRFSKNGGQVTARITVKGPVQFKFEFYDNTRMTSGDHKNGPTHNIDLSPTDELHLHENSWSVRLGSPSGQVAEYTVTITWIQDDNTLHIWTRGGKLSADDPMNEVHGRVGLVEV